MSAPVLGRLYPVLHKWHVLQLHADVQPVPQDPRATAPSGQAPGLNLRFSHRERPDTPDRAWRREKDQLQGQHRQPRVALPLRQADPASPVKHPNQLGPLLSLCLLLLLARFLVLVLAWLVPQLIPVLQQALLHTSLPFFLFAFPAFTLQPCSPVHVLACFLHEPSLYSRLPAQQDRFQYV